MSNDKSKKKIKRNLIDESIITNLDCDGYVKPTDERVRRIPLGPSYRFCKNNHLPTNWLHNR